MLRHLVLLRFQKDIPEQTKEDLMQQLADLRQHLSGVLDFRHTDNVSVEIPLVRGFTKVFWFDFADTQARDAYLEDAAHQAVGAKLVQHLEGGLEGVFVCDIEIEN